MAFSRLTLLLLVISMLLSIQAQVDQLQASYDLAAETLEWPWTMSVYDESWVGNDVDDEEQDHAGIDIARRSLYRKAKHYYISYGALSSNRVPCPPRSGRSYYTHNCFKARQPSNPYTRGCSRITHCRR
ncbi:hypothetical protein ACOSP7_010665 [Xanthoceras sorbifolium]